MKWTQQLMMATLMAASLGIEACNAAGSKPTTQTSSPTAIPPAVRSEEHVFAGGVPPQAGTMKNPLERDKKAATDGEKLFSAMNCDGCHGVGATGWVGPSLVDGRWRYGGTDGEVFHSIYFGRPRGMPAFGGLLPPDAIWRLVTYLRSQPAPDDVPTESWK